METPMDTDVKVEEPSFLCNVHICRLGSFLYYYLMIINWLMLFFKLMGLWEVFCALLCCSFAVLTQISSVIFFCMYHSVTTTHTCRLYQGWLVLIFDCCLSVFLEIALCFSIENFASLFVACLMPNCLRNLFCLDKCWYGNTTCETKSRKENPVKKVKEEKTDQGILRSKLAAQTFQYCRPGFCTRDNHKQRIIVTKYSFFIIREIENKPVFIGYKLDHISSIPSKAVWTTIHIYFQFLLKFHLTSKKTHHKSV